MTWQQVEQELTAMADIYGKAISQAAAHMFISDLSKYRPDHVLAALARCRLEMRTFPTVADVVSRMPGTVTDDTLAVESVSRIVQAIGRIGNYRPEDAREFIGTLGWEVVRRYGGWQEVCSITETGVFRAQAFRIAKAVIEQYRAGSLYLPTALELPRLEDKR